MNYNPKINLDRFEASFKAIDAHTAGEFCRIVYSGFPSPRATPLSSASTGWKSTITTIALL